MAKQRVSLSNILELKVDKSTLRVKNRESETREFKLAFENNSLPKYAKAMAAFANRDGGVLFFGVKDKPRELVGIEERNIPDDVVITNFLKEYFQPEVQFQSETKSVHGKPIHALVVRESSRKPVICKKAKSIRTEQGKPDKEVLREGAIYYRYSASTDEIKYADLRSLLDTERESFFKSMVDNITLLNKVGVDKAAVVDAEDLAGNNQAASVFLTNETAQSLNWIDSGRFVEEESQGDKAYYVVRNVVIKQGVEIPKPTDASKTHPLTKTALSKAVKISGASFDAALWKLGLKDNPKYHISTNHGKNKLHKFIKDCEGIILKAYPLDMERRTDSLKEIAEEYKEALRS